MSKTVVYGDSEPVLTIEQRKARADAWAKGVFVRYERDGLQAELSDRTGLDCSGEASLTQQQFADECDINQIMARYQRSEVMNLRSDFQSAHYADLSTVPDYHEACNIVASANEAFDALDAHIRKKFDNDPSKFLAFVSDPKNVDRFEEFGLLKPADDRVSASKGAGKGPSGTSPSPAGADAPKPPSGGV